MHLIMHFDITKIATTLYIIMHFHNHYTCRKYNALKHDKQLIFRCNKESANIQMHFNFVILWNDTMYNMNIFKCYIKKASSVTK